MPLGFSGGNPRGGWDTDLTDWTDFHGFNLCLSVKSVQSVSHPPREQRHKSQLNHHPHARYRRPRLRAQRFQLVPLLPRGCVRVFDDAAADGRAVLVERAVEDEGGDADGVAGDVFDVEVNVQAPAVEEPALVNAEVNRAAHVAALGVQAGEVGQAGIAHVPTIHQGRGVGKGRDGQRGLEAPVEARFPVLAEFFAQSQVHDMAGIPRGGHVFAVFILKLALAQGVAGDAIKTLVQPLLEQKLDAVGAPGAAAHGWFVADDAKVTAEVGQREAVAQQEGVVGVFLEITLYRDFAIRLGVPSEARHGMVGPDVLDIVLFVHKNAALLVAEDGVGRELEIAARVEIERKLLRKRVGGREAGRELFQRVVHVVGIGIGVHAGTEREHEAVAEVVAAHLSEQCVFVHVELAAVVHRLRAGAREDAVESAVVVLHELVASAVIHLEIPVAAGVFHPELVLDFLRFIVQNEVVFRAFVVFEILHGLVVQHIAAGHHGPVAFRSVMLVNQAVGVVPLRVHGQLVEDELLVFGLVGVEVQLEIVNGAEADEIDFVLLVDFMLHLGLKIVVGGQKRQFQGLEQKLQIRPPGREQEGRFLANWAVQGEASVRGTEHEGRPQLVGAAIGLPEVEGGTERVAPIGGESAAVKIHFGNKVHVDEADRAAAAALRGEVVDVRHLHVVEEEAVLVRGAAADDEVVAEAGRRRDAGQGLYHFGDIAVAAGVALDFRHAEGAQAEGAFLRLFEGRSLHHHFLQISTLLFQFKIDDGGLRVHHLYFGLRLVVEADEAGLHVVEAGGEARYFVVAVLVGGGPGVGADCDDVCKNDGFVGQGIGDGAADAACLGKNGDGGQ